MVFGDSYQGTPFRRIIHDWVEQAFQACRKGKQHPGFSH
jgi:hypothetical protein